VARGRESPCSRRNGRRRERWPAGKARSTKVVDIEAFDGVRKIIQNSAVPIPRRGRAHHRRGHRQRGYFRAHQRRARAARVARADADADGRLMRRRMTERPYASRSLQRPPPKIWPPLKMHLARLTRTGDRSVRRMIGAAIARAWSWPERSMAGIRTLSYLLHPPFLDEGGTAVGAPLVRGGICGTQRRQGRSRYCPRRSGACRRTWSTALFRVVQESLIQHHRHAASPSAQIRLRVDAGCLALEIEDRGRACRGEKL